MQLIWKSYYRYNLLAYKPLEIVTVVVYYRVSFIIQRVFTSDIKSGPTQMISRLAKWQILLNAIASGWTEMKRRKRIRYIFIKPVFVSYIFFPNQT